MGNEKGKWIQFEDGLRQNEGLENKLVNINWNSYKQFREKCVNQKLAEERRVILIFFGTISGKRKKDKCVNTDVHSTEKLLIESIMDACTRSKDGKGEFFTAAVVKCEDSEIENAAYIDGKEIEEKKNNTQIDSAKKVLDKGGRIIDKREISLWEKYVLIDKDIRENAKNHTKNFLSIAFGILVQYWPLIIAALYFVTVYLQEKIIEPYGYMLIIGGVIYGVIYRYGKMALKRAREDVRNEIKYYRCLDYPVIFYNGTGKTKRWMKNYIQKYMEGEDEGKTKESVFYIGAADFKIEEEKIHNFIIPEGHPEWGLICLCKLVRDLADNPWGEIWSGTAIIDNIKDESVFSPSLEADKEQNDSDPQLRIFKMPKDEKALSEEIEKKKTWHFARDPDSEDPRSRLFPIGNSVYAIRKNISWSDFKGEVIKLQTKIIPGIDVFATPITYNFWLIQVDEKEYTLIERLNMILSFPTREEDLWFDIWNSIIQLVENLQNEKISRLCEKVLDDKMPKYLKSFEEYKKLLENSLKEKVDKDKNVQEELVKRKTKC